MENSITENGEILLKIDCNKKIKQLIAEGNYCWVSTANAKNLPASLEKVKEEIVLTTKLFRFKREISSQNAIKLMAREGYRPATLVELLVLGATYPKLQKDGPIIALGSVWPSTCGFCRVLSLDFEGGNRRVTLSWLNFIWNPGDRFLGVLINPGSEEC